MLSIFRDSLYRWTCLDPKNVFVIWKYRAWFHRLKCLFELCSSYFCCCTSNPSYSFFRERSRIREEIIARRQQKLLLMHTRQKRLEEATLREAELLQELDRFVFMMFTFFIILDALVLLHQRSLFLHLLLY